MDGMMVNWRKRRRNGENEIKQIKRKKGKAGFE